MKLSHACTVLQLEEAAIILWTLFKESFWHNTVSIIWYLLAVLHFMNLLSHINVRHTKSVLQILYYYNVPSNTTCTHACMHSMLQYMYCMQYSAILPWIIRSAVDWIISEPLIARHVTVMLLCCCGAVKLNENRLPPLGRSVWFATLPTTVGVVVIPIVTPLSSEAQVNSTNVPTLTFLDLGTAESVMTDWVPAWYMIQHYETPKNN